MLLFLIGSVSKGVMIDRSILLVFQPFDFDFGWNQDRALIKVSATMEVEVSLHSHRCHGGSFNGRGGGE